MAATDCKGQYNGAVTSSQIRRKPLRPGDINTPRQCARYPANSKTKLAAPNCQPGMSMAIRQRSASGPCRQADKIAPSSKTWLAENATKPISPTALIGLRHKTDALCIYPLIQRERCGSHTLRLSGASSLVGGAIVPTRYPRRVSRNPRSASSVTFHASQPDTSLKADTRK